MATRRSNEIAQRILRITDVEVKSSAMNTPVIDYPNTPTITYDDTPILSLEKAVEPLIPLLPDIVKYASDAKRECKNPPADGLTLDQSASIRLYTMEWQPRNKCLYVSLNSTLRTKDKGKLRYWFRYLKLFLTALERLPSKHRQVYRGIKLDLHKRYLKNGSDVWWGFSSCTKSIGVLKQDLFLGKTGNRTMFTIECESGKDIQAHSAISDEDEILLFAATQFTVIDSLDHGNGLHMIQLQETKPVESLLQFLLASSSSADSNINVSEDGYQKSIQKLERIVNKVNIFTDAEKCQKFLAGTNETKVFLIISGALGERVVPTVHEMGLIGAIFIFCGNKSRREQWAKKWTKIRGVFTDISPLCECVELICKTHQEDALTMTSFALKPNLNQPDSTYMYTKIFIEILLEIRFGSDHLKDFANYFRELYDNNVIELKIIDQFQQEYRVHTPIWWYTRQCFVFKVGVPALRAMDFKTMIKMGFFIGDLHRQLEQLHSEQFDEHHHKQSSFVVYRGLCLNKMNFDNLRARRGGVITFNDFLSVSPDREVSVRFAHRGMTNPDQMGVLLKISVDPSVPSTPFAFISDFSYYSNEEEMLFSMNSVFRITDVKQIDNDNRLWEVSLTLISDADLSSHALTANLRTKLTGSTGWARLGKLLLQVGQFTEAAEIYEMLLSCTRHERDKSIFYHQLGSVKSGLGEYKDALCFYEKSLAVRVESLPATHPDMAESYSAIGSLYNKMGDYSKALSYEEKALAIRQKALPMNHPDIAESNNNIGIIYCNIHEYSKALSFHEKSLAARQMSLPTNHPDVAESYHNLGLLYDKMGEHQEALSYHEKALEIRQISLPPTHLDLAESYSNMGLLYCKTGEHSKVLSYCERAVDIGEKTLPSSHPKLKLWRKTLESVKESD